MGLDIVELVMNVEREFGIEIANADAPRLRTVGRLFGYVRARVGYDEKADVGYDGPLWERYLDVVAHSTCIPRSELRPEADFVYDLRLD